MKFKQAFVFSAYTFLAASTITAPSPAFSASQDECSIWLCLPSGFPTGCSAAYSAFRDRVRRMRPPLPPLASCLISSSSLPAGVQQSTMTYRYDVAAFMPTRRRCVAWGGGDGGNCVRYQTIPAGIVKGTGCRISEAGESPQGCVRTGRYIDIFSNGQQIGETYAW